MFGMTAYKMSDRFVIPGLQLGMLHMLTDYDDQATEIVEKVLEHKMEASE